MDLLWAIQIDNISIRWQYDVVYAHVWYLLLALLLLANEKTVFQTYYKSVYVF